MSGLIRDPAEWARASGWVSRLRVERAATRLRGLAEGIREAGGDFGGVWADELEEIAAYLAPKPKKACPK